MDSSTIEYIKSSLIKIHKDCLNSNLSILASGIDSALRNLETPMQLAIIGRISSSKSTLVNAILGKDEVMATGKMEVTYNVGWLKYGNPNSDIIIHYKDKKKCNKESSL